MTFWVQDSGNGLLPEEQEKLFSQFSQLHPTSSEGHGLGLSIVKRIIEKLNGEVGVESTGRPGEGARFWFTLEKAD